MGTQLRELSESYLINTNMTRFKWFWMKVASALEGHKPTIITTLLHI